MRRRSGKQASKKASRRALREAFDDAASAAVATDADVIMTKLEPSGRNQPLLLILPLSHLRSRDSSRVPVRVVYRGPSWAIAALSRSSQGRPRNEKRELPIRDVRPTSETHIPNHYPLTSKRAHASPSPSHRMALWLDVHVAACSIPHGHQYWAAWENVNL